MIIKHKIKLFLAASFLVITCFAPVAALASVQDIEGNLRAAAEQGAGYGKPQDPRTTAAVIIRTALSAIGIIFVILMIYAGFLWMTSHGNDEQVSKAKRTLTAAVIGFAIIVMAYAITLLVTFMVTGGNRNAINTNPPQSEFTPFSP